MLVHCPICKKKKLKISTNEETGLFFAKCSNCNLRHFDWRNGKPTTRKRAEGQRGMWLVAGDREVKHYYLHNCAWSICGSSQREQVKLRVLAGKTCKACAKARDAVEYGVIPR